MAAGDVIGLLHSDDFFYDNGVISRIVKQMKTTRADFLYGDGLFVNPDNTDKVVRNWIGGDYRLWKVRHGWLPLHPTCYIRREVMMRLGLYNESYKIAADSELLVRYLMTVMSLPFWPENAPNTFSSSARRNSWVMTWRAVAAARRPKSRGVSSYSSPSLGAG